MRGLTSTVGVVGDWRALLATLNEPARWRRYYSRCSLFLTAKPLLTNYTFYPIAKCLKRAAILEGYLQQIPLSQDFVLGIRKSSKSIFPKGA